MSGIAVAVQPATTAGRLYPRYDDEAGIVAVGSRVPRDWPFGVDLDGRVVFDLDQHRVLANFDLHVPKSRWQPSLGAKEIVPAIAPAGDIVFSEEAIAQKSFHMALRARCDSRRKVLRLEFGEAEADRSVELSEHCLALLAGQNLVGFVVRFGS